MAVMLATTGAGASPASPAQPDPNFAGYLASHTHHAGHMTLTFVVPTLNCTGISAHLDVFPGADVRAAGGASATVAGIDLGCNGGADTYQAQVDFNSSTITLPMTISPGDTVVATVNVTTGSSTGSIHDVTSGVTKTASGSGFTPTGTKAGVFSTVVGGTELGVPPFGTLTFSAVNVGGAPIGSFPVTRFNRTNGSTLQIKTKNLQPGGTAFDVVFKHN
jgi:hypothetical protein